MYSTVSDPTQYEGVQITHRRACLTNPNSVLPLLSMGKSVINVLHAPACSNKYGISLDVVRTSTVYGDDWGMPKTSTTLILCEFSSPAAIGSVLYFQPDFWPVY